VTLAVTWVTALAVHHYDQGEMVRIEDKTARDIAQAKTEVARVKAQAEAEFARVESERRIAEQNWDNAPQTPACTQQTL